MFDFPTGGMPQMCGGLSQHINNDAPKTIESRDMIFFSAQSSFRTLVSNCPIKEEYAWIDFISVYAVKINDGSFLCLNARDAYERHESVWAFVKKDIFPKLADMVISARFAEKNGIYRFINGLPQNFGGEVHAGYASGEKLGFSDNQTPVFSKQLGTELYELFSEAMKAEHLPLPDAEKITGVKLYEKNSSGYSSAELKKNPDGSYTLLRTYKFEAPEPHEYIKEAGAEVIEKIRKIAASCAVMMWDKFPQREYQSIIQKSLTFTLSDGSKITVPDDRISPLPLSNAFYSIERELI